MKIISTLDRKGLADVLGKESCGSQLRVVRAAMPTSVNEQERTVQFILSDETRDHAGDIIRQAGWDLSVFQANPVLPWCHNYEEPPLGGWEDVMIKEGKLIGTARFATAEDYPFADTIFRLTARGFLRGVSVGFNPMRWNKEYDEKQNFLGYEFLEQMLLECSACTLPMNPSALVRSVHDGIISKRELGDMITRRIFAEINLSTTEDVAGEVTRAIESFAGELEQIKALFGADGAGGRFASSPAPTSVELARCLELIKEIKSTANKG